MSTEITGGIDAAAVETRAAQSTGWLAARRREAWDLFGTMPWPSSMTDEDWRRTDIAKLNVARYHFDETPTPALDAVVTQTLDEIETVAAGAAVAVQDSSGRVQLRNADALTAQGVVVCSLDEASVRHTDLVQRALALVPAGDQPLTTLWNALWRGGVFVYVPKSVTASVPLWVVHAVEGDLCAGFGALAVVVDENAVLRINEIHTSPRGDADVFTNVVTALVQERDSRVEYGVLQTLGTGTWHMATHHTSLASGAGLRFFGASLGSRLQKAWWHADLDGAGAEADIAGIAVARGTQHLDHQSLQAHRAPDTTSRLLLKAAVDDKARSVYSGLIDVAREAQRTDAHVQNRNLILSHGAKADSVPRLEIRAHDVRCGHGATAGHMDEDQLFYLRSRGVTQGDAERMVLRGFLDDAVAHAPQGEFAQLVGRILDRELGTSSRGGEE